MVAVRGVLAANPAQLIVDGQTGSVEIPSKPVTPFAAEATAAVSWNGVGTTSDGLRVKILANVGSAKDAKAAAEAGAEGVGLFRTEFCYLDATDEPSVEEQHTAYAAVLAPFHGKPIIVRTLDAGADKPLAFSTPTPSRTRRSVCVASASPANGLTCWNASSPRSSPPLRKPVPRSR